MALAVVLYPVKGVRELYAFTQGSPASYIDKEVGLWIGTRQAREVRIMDLSTPLPRAYTRLQQEPMERETRLTRE